MKAIQKDGAVVPEGTGTEGDHIRQAVSVKRTWYLPVCGRYGDHKIVLTIRQK